MWLTKIGYYPSDYQCQDHHFYEDSDDEIATLPVRSASPSQDRTPALYGYQLDSGDDSSDEDLSETADSLHTQTA
ncbi:hypothetical protein Tco_1213033 [Tanacetum coccineum]